MKGDSHMEFSICLKQNLPKDVFIRPNKSQSSLKQVCRLCAYEFHEIIHAQQIKDSNQDIIKNFEVQAKLNSNQVNLALHQLISIRDLINKSVENLIQELRNQLYIQDSLVKEVKSNLLQKEDIAQEHQKYIARQKRIQVYAIQQIVNIRAPASHDQMIKVLEGRNFERLNVENQKKEGREEAQEQRTSKKSLTKQNKEWLTQNQLRQNKESMEDER